jgi:YidC/Oxa1 family membrane protein insertase
MISDFFSTVLYEPLYNGLVFLITVIPGGDVGLAIISLTIAVKFALLPLTHKSTKSQAKLKTLEPEAQEIREKHKKDKQEQARKIMELYQKHGVNPFSGCFLLLIQLPIILALYFVFFKGLADGINTELLYAFVPYTTDTLVNMNFLGTFEMLGKSLILAALAGLTQHFQIRLSFPEQPKNGKEEKPKKDGEIDMREEFAKNMKTQMKYVLPGIIFIVAYQISAAVALYWTTSNIFSIIHELIVRREARQITEGENKTDA